MQANDPHVNPPTNKAEEEDPQRSATVPWLDGQQHGVNAQVKLAPNSHVPWQAMVASGWKQAALPRTAAHVMAGMNQAHADSLCRLLKAQLQTCLLTAGGVQGVGCHSGCLAISG
jgi:hypothetical protein